MTNPTNSPMDITNQKFGVMGSPADTTYVLRAITVGNIPVIRKFIVSNSGVECIFQCAGIRASNHAAHEQRLKNRPAKAEAEDVCDDHLGDARKLQEP